MFRALFLAGALALAIGTSGCGGYYDVYPELGYYGGLGYGSVGVSVTPYRYGYAYPRYYGRYGYPYAYRSPFYRPYPYAYGAYPYAYRPYPFLYPRLYPPYVWG